MHSFSNRCILVLEDEFFLAEELVSILVEEDATVAGPYSSLEGAMTFALDDVDGAILNVRIRSGTSYPMAHRLRERRIPFVFASGQDRTSEPKEWHDHVWVTKPYEAKQIIEALLRVMGLPRAA